MILPFLLIVSFSHSTFADFTQPQEVFKTGTGACKEPWALEIQQKYAVRLDYEYWDKAGTKVLPAIATPYGVNPMQFCSGSIARVGSAQQIKLVTAAHCLKSEFRGGIAKYVNVQRGLPPDSQFRKKLVARFGGQSVEIKIGKGPDFKYDSSDKADSFRRDDFAIADTQPSLEQLLKKIEPPPLCPPGLKLEEIESTVVIGSGVTDSGKVSPTPLCGVQKIGAIEKGILVAKPLEKDDSSACAGDSGAGLWALPKTTRKPCLLGNVSGPKLNSIDPERAKNRPPSTSVALWECTQEGIQPIYASVYQQPGAVDYVLTGRQSQQADAAR